MRRIVLSSIITSFFLLPATIFAQSVDILWQGETYTPPFYKGLPLWTNESRVTFVAVPHIPGKDADSLVYRWSKGNTVLGSLSGVNKRSLSLADTVLSEPVRITIDIFENNGSSPLASNTINLTPREQKLIVVENSPIYGLLFNKSIKQTFELKEDEVTFSAIPLFSVVSTRLAPAIEYTWTTSAGDARKEDSVTYRKPQGGGSASITLRTLDSKLIMQPKPINFLIKFDKDSNL